MLYAQQLIQTGQIALVKQYLWTGDERERERTVCATVFVERNFSQGNDNIYGGGAIKRDLDWAATGWNTNTCDLWEEVQSNDFFWNRMSHNRFSFFFALRFSPHSSFAQIRALYSGALFATLMGDADSAARYSQVLRREIFVFGEQ
jgi:hypothetical protein